MFHTQPSEIWEMDVDELHAWVKRAAWITEKVKSRG